jgi:hypothetical protein
MSQPIAYGEGKARARGSCRRSQWSTQFRMYGRAVRRAYPRAESRSLWPRRLRISSRSDLRLALRALDHSITREVGS